MSEGMFTVTPAEGDPFAEKLRAEWEARDTSATPRLVTSAEFMERFTPEEMGTIAVAAAKAAAAGDPRLQVWKDRLIVRPTVDLNHPDVAAAMDTLVAAKLLTRARADEILASEK